MGYLIAVIVIILGATLVFLMLKIKEVEVALFNKAKKSYDEELRHLNEDELNNRIDLYHSSAFPDEGTKNLIKDGLLFLINDYAEEYGEEYGKKLRDKLFNENPYKELLKDIDLKVN